MEASLGAVPSELEFLTAYESADLLLPNAVGEADSIRRDFGVSTPMTPVPNGVDPLSFSESSAPFEDRRYVLFVGRIDPHKNQLGAIRALRGSGLPLVIAGHDHPHHPEYTAQCRDEGGDWVTFTGEVSHDSAELADLYHGARVHLLPSWFETTGLVSLEAALSGCSVVSTSLGHAREYLDDLAWYCDPGPTDVDPRRRATGMGLTADRSTEAAGPGPVHLEARGRGNHCRLPPTGSPV